MRFLFRVKSFILMCGTRSSRWFSSPKEIIHVLIFCITFLTWSRHFQNNFLWIDWLTFLVNIVNIWSDRICLIWSFWTFIDRIRIFVRNINHLGCAGFRRFYFIWFPCRWLLFKVKYRRRRLSYFLIIYLLDRT